MFLDEVSQWTLQAEARVELDDSSFVMQLTGRFLQKCANYVHPY